MKLKSILQAMFTRTCAKKPRRAAPKPAARFRRPNLHLEQLEDRALLSGPGDIEWLRQFGSLTPGGNTIARAVDADGNVYVAGSTSGALPGQISAGQGGDDAFVVKFDAAGNELWTRQFGTSLPDQAAGVAVDATGVYVVGFTTGTLPGQTSAGGQDAFVRKYDADGNEQWTRQFGTPGDPSLVSEQATGVAVDATGIYVAGFTTGTLPGQTNSGFFDAFVRKYDAAGAEQWTSQFGSSGVDQATGISVDAGSVYVAGRTQGSLPGQSQNGILTDGFVRKYDAAGNPQWTRQFGTNLDDFLTGVAADASGVSLVGTTQGVFPGQVKSGNFVDVDAFVRKYDPAGNEAWTSQFGTSAPDNAFGVAASASDVYVVGGTLGALPGQSSGGSTDAYMRKFDSAGSVVLTRQFGTGGTDRAIGIALDGSSIYIVGSTSGIFPGQSAGPLFLSKFDASATEVWTRQFGSSFFARNDVARGVDADGNVYVVGDVVVPSRFNRDVFVRKYDAVGNLLWTHEFGTLGDDRGLGVAVDASGVYVAGLVNGSLALPGQTPGGGDTDAFVRKYDAAGNVIWTRQFGAPFVHFPVVTGVDSATSIAVDATGIYVAGATNGVFPGHTNPGGFPHDDAFVRKYDFNGNPVWTRQFGAAGPDVATSVGVAASGIYVAGTTNGSLPGQTSAGGQDAFVLKYDTNGNLVWTHQFGTPAVDQALGVAADATGIYVAGGTLGALPGQVSAGNNDAFVRKYDAGGTEIWTSQFGSADSDLANGIAVGASGIYVAGQIGATLPGQTSAGGQDAFVGKLDGSGNQLWIRQFGTAAADSANGITVSAAGLFVAGFTTGTFAGQTSFGLEDIFVAKIVDTVSNTPPSNVVLNLNSSVDENGTAILNGSFTDPDAADTHTVVINWGPGEDTTTLNLAAGVTTFTASHLYHDDNPAGTPSDIYAINVTVSDASANASASTSLTVNNLPPAAGISGPSSGLSGDSLVFTLTAIDPSPVDSEAGFTFHIDWDGDGVIDEMVTGPSGMTIAHSYGAPGLYDVRVTAEDKDTGLSDAATIVVHVLAPPTIQGLVWLDSNDDGEVNFGETAVPGVTITLTGIDDLGQSVDRVVQTDASGVYVFANLRPSNADGYTIAETQPAAYPDGRDTLGTVNGVPVGSNAVNDVFSGIVLSQGGLLAENYNFGERPATTGGVSAGQTATIGYWQNRNGQKLIQALNGGPSATQLGHWLAVTFPNMYGALDGKTNAEVAAHYKTLFSRCRHKAPGGPPKTDAQVLATAFAVYVTNQTLAGTTAAAYGFQVSATGVGMRTFNVGNNGAAFGAANHSNVSVMDLLLAVNARSHNGLLYDQNGDGQISSSEAGYRTMANDVFSSINEAGDI